MSRFSNLPEDAAPLEPRERREGFDRQVRNLERISRLPSGDPELLRLFRGPVVPLPPPDLARQYAAEHDRRVGGRCACELCESLREAVSELRGPAKCGPGKGSGKARS